MEVEIPLQAIVIEKVMICENVKVVELTAGVVSFSVDDDEMAMVVVARAVEVCDENLYSGLAECCGAHYYCMVPEIS